MTEDPVAGMTADLAVGLREVLIGKGYAADGINTTPPPVWPPSTLTRAEPDLITLRQLFRFGDEVGERAAEEALAPLSVDALVSAGSLRRAHRRVSAAVSIVPIDGLLVAGDSDFGRPDCVPGLNQAALLLANLTPRSAVDTTLDLGTGCGVQALLAARHSAHVVGVDINPRALRYAAFNAAMNGLENIEWCAGSWFEPVRLRRFDLIVANPPFVISPERTYVFRDGGPEADSLCRSLVSSIIDHLRPGGTGAVVCNWVTTAEGDWTDAPRSWIADGPCDGLLIHYGTEDALSYARRWNRSLGPLEPSDGQSAVGRWVEHYRRDGIEAVSSGAVILRRRARGPGRIHAAVASDAPDGPGGAQVERMLAAVAHLAGAEGDDGLMDEIFTLLDPHRLDESLAYADGKYTASAMVMRLVPGIGVPGLVDPRVAQIVLACDGRRSLRELVDGARPSTDAERDELARRSAATFKGLYRNGVVALTDPGEL